MPKTGYLVILLSIWLFAIFAPSVITLWSEDNNVIVTTTLNEEEQNEKGKELNEKQIIKVFSTDLSLISRFYTKLLFSYIALNTSDSPLEIHLPPPKLSHSSC